MCVCVPFSFPPCPPLGSWSAQLVGEAPWVWHCFGAAAALSLQPGSGFKHKASWGASLCFLVPLTPHPVHPPCLCGAVPFEMTRN